MKGTSLRVYGLRIRQSISQCMPENAQHTIAIASMHKPAAVAYLPWLFKPQARQQGTPLLLSLSQPIVHQQSCKLGVLNHRCNSVQCCNTRQQTPHWWDLGYLRSRGGGTCNRTAQRRSARRLGCENVLIDINGGCIPAHGRGLLRHARPSRLHHHDTGGDTQNHHHCHKVSA